MLRCKAFIAAIVVPVALVLMFTLLLPDAAASPAIQTDTLVETQTQHLKTEPVEQYWSRLIGEYGGFFPENRPPSFMELMKGEAWSPSHIFKGLIRYALHEVLHNGKLLASIVVLTVFGMILETI